MLCLVQSFQQGQETSSKGKRLSFIRRKKPPSDAQPQGEHLLSNDVREPSRPFGRQDKQGLKHLSGSAPSMTCAPLDPSLTPSTCRSRQKKFLRHFKVDPDEQVIDYFSCALVADILLQGHLYISKNYFAFYSNVFGYVTKLLIPTSSVVNVTKEKTAFILPNAVGVATADDRHVFSSLLSRETTYKLMVQVWHAALSSRTSESTVSGEADVDSLLCDESSSPSGSESALLNCKGKSTVLPEVEVYQHVSHSDTVEPATYFPSLPRSTLLLAVSTVLLIVLFLSASVLMYRLIQLQHSLSTQHSEGPRSILEVQRYLDTNLNNLYKVQQSLKTLSTLMEKEKLAWAKLETEDNSIPKPGPELPEELLPS